MTLHTRWPGSRARPFGVAARVALCTLGLARPIGAQVTSGSVQASSYALCSGATPRRASAAQARAAAAAVLSCPASHPLLCSPDVGGSTSCLCWQRGVHPDDHHGLLYDQTPGVLTTVTVDARARLTGLQWVVPAVPSRPAAYDALPALLRQTMLDAMRRLGGGGAALAIACGGSAPTLSVTYSAGVGHSVVRTLHYGAAGTFARETQFVMHNR